MITTDWMNSSLWPLTQHSTLTLSAVCSMPIASRSVVSTQCEENPGDATSSTTCSKLTGLKTQAHSDTRTYILSHASRADDCLYAATNTRTHTNTAAAGRLTRFVKLGMHGCCFQLKHWIKHHQSSVKYWQIYPGMSCQLWITVEEIRRQIG